MIHILEELLKYEPYGNTKGPYKLLSRGAGKSRLLYECTKVVIQYLDTTQGKRSLVLYNTR